MVCERDTETQSELSDTLHNIYNRANIIMLWYIILYGRLIHMQAIYYLCIYIHIYSYTLVYYIIPIYILIKKSVNTILFFTHIYGNHIAWSFEAKESEDEW